jgi:uncharacterized protein (TIGR03437 family)
MPILYRRTVLAFFLVGIALTAPTWADQSGNVTLDPNAFFNLDTGVASSAGGDILWNGVSLVPQGHAALFNAGKYGPRAYQFVTASQASAAPYKSEPIPAGNLSPGDVFGVRTNGGNFAKVLVTASGNTRLSLRYTTFITARPTTPAPRATSGPTITGVLNNYSYILPGLPNYGIAPGSLFVIFGSGLSSSAPPVLQSSAPPGLPTSLNQTSISVTVNGVKTTPAIYYTSAAAVAAVLPSNTPVGAGTVTVTYNGTASNAAPIQVVASAPGLDTLYGTGNGSGVVTDNSGNVFGFTNSAMPSQIIVLWGSGLGADLNNDDRTYPQTEDNLTSIPVQVLIGGISANVLYRGRSQYPGLDQFDVVVPSTVSPGCFVSVTMAVGSVVSNSVTMPISPGGGVCTDPASGVNGTMLQTFANKPSGNVNFQLIALLQLTESGGNTSSAALVAAAPLPSAYFGKGYEYASQGSCTVVPPGQGEPSFLGSQLSVGSIQMTGPNGVVNLSGGQTALPGPTIAAGTYTFTGAAGANVGSYQAAVSFQSPLVVTNKAALATITRSQSATVTWTGGFANGDVQVEGEDGGPYGTVRFYCHAPSSAGQLVIPPSIMMALSAGGGDIVVSNFTAPTTVTASGVDFGFAIGLSVVQINTTFK